MREAGLSLAYVGAESGDDEVLLRVSKGETFESTREALDKLAVEHPQKAELVSTLPTLRG